MRREEAFHRRPCPLLQFRERLAARHARAGGMVPPYAHEIGVRLGKPPERLSLEFALVQLGDSRLLEQGRVESLRDDFGGAPRAPERTRVDAGDRASAQRAGERFGLRDAYVVERGVGDALDALFDVPVRLTVPQEIEKQIGQTPVGATPGRASP